MLGFTINAQVVEDTVPVEKTIEEQNLEPEGPFPGQSDVETAKKNYAQALANLEEARQMKIAAENALEQSRVTLRTAELAERRQEKADNPIVIERYDPLINPIFEEMSKGSNYGLSTFIEGAEKDGIKNILSKNVDAEFKTYMKQFRSTKVKKQKGEVLFDNVLIPQMASTTMDLYTDFVDREDGVEIRTYFNTGSSFLNFSDNSASVNYANSLMEQFARYIRGKSLEAELSSLEKELDKTMKDSEKNKEDIQKSKAEIQESDTKIAEMRNKIGEYDTAIDTINDRLEITRNKLSKVN